MITQAVRRARISGCIAVLAAFGLVSSATGQKAATDLNPTITFEPERSTMGGALVYRSATMLVRTRDDVTGTIRTSGLVPGNVYTGWFGIFNHPEKCSTRPCNPPVDLANPAVQGALLNMGGQIAGADGTVNFAEVRAVGDTTNAHLGPPGLAVSPGLLNPRGAEIHLAVRHHGPAALLPADLALQLTTFNGGCPPFMCATIQAAVHAP